MTTLDDVVREGWGAHADDTAAVAERLEAAVDLVADAEGAAGYMHLVNHAVGDHLGDRDRALRLCEAAMGRLGEPEPGALIHLAVARHLAGDADGGREAQAAAGGDAGTEVRVDMLVAQGHAHAGDWARCDALYRAALCTAEALEAGHTAERAVAVVSNNVAGELLEMEARTPAQDALLELVADAARTFWLRVGDWMNDMRADYLLSLVRTALGRPDEGRALAERGLATIAENGEAEVDAAFLHLARARACRDLGAIDAQDASIEEAVGRAKRFEDEGLETWFETELAKAR